MRASNQIPSTITAYLSEIGRIAILSKDQQLFHGKRIRKWVDWPEGEDNAPDPVKRAGIRSMNRMIESNLRMVVSIAKKYSNQGVSIEDLIQEGNMGLMIACRKFDPERGYCFSTFSYWWIRQGITRCLANSSRIIRVPCNASELSRKIRTAQAEWIAKHGRLATIEELSKKINCGVDRIQLAIQATTIQPRSLDQVAVEDGSPLVDLIAAPDSVDLASSLETQMMMDRLMDMIEGLPNLERLTLQGVAFQRLTHREVAEQLQLSTTRVGQLYRLAVQRLRERVKLEDSTLDAINTQDLFTGLTSSRACVRVTPGAATSTATSTTSNTQTDRQRYENFALPA